MRVQGGTKEFSAIGAEVPLEAAAEAPGVRERLFLLYMLADCFHLDPSLVAMSHSGAR